MTLSFLTDPPTGNFYTFTGKKISRRKSKAAIKKFFDHFYDLSGAEELEGVTSLKQYYYHVLSEDEEDDTELMDCMTGLSQVCICIVTIIIIILLQTLSCMYGADLARVSLELARGWEVINKKDALVPGGMGSVVRALERKIELSMNLCKVSQCPDDDLSPRWLCGQWTRIYFLCLYTRFLNVKALKGLPGPSPGTVKLRESLLTALQEDHAEWEGRGRAGRGGH